MIRTAILTILGILLIAPTIDAQPIPKRIAISPSTLVNLNSSDIGEPLGIALAGDFYMTDHFAIRTILGFSQDRLSTGDNGIVDKNYSFSFTLGPYYEVGIGRTVRPYTSLLVIVGKTEGVERFNNEFPGTMPGDLVERIGPKELSGSIYYSFGFLIGGKLHFYDKISLFADITQYFYTNNFGGGHIFSGETVIGGQSFNFDGDPTYFSVGISYSFDLNKYH